MRRYPHRVSPFGNPRIKACLTAPRGLSQPGYVLLRLSAPRHPPYALCSFYNARPDSIESSCSVVNVPRNGRHTSGPRAHWPGVGLSPHSSPSVPTSRSLVPGPGGGEGVRTPGLLRAREALSQLSYTPRSLGVGCQGSGTTNRGPEVRTNLQRLTPGLVLWPPTPSSRPPRWAFVVSNHRPRSYQDRALTS